MDFSAGGSGSGSGGGGGGGGGGDGGPGDGRAQAERWLEIAEKLLAARDLVGCKRFAERAVEADPLLPGADELLAVADVLLASQSMGASGHPDPLAILQLPPGASPDHAAVSRAFRRLALLLGQRNPHPGAEMALRLVNDAYAILSDPSRRAPPSANPATGTPSSYQYAAAAAAAPAPDPLEFWTACPFCCYVHQYPRDLIGRALRCPNEGCRRGFVASEIPTPPTVVPGTEMYHCAWGFFPLGLPNAADLGTNWKPFYKVFPWNTAPSGQGGGGGRGSRGGRQPQNDSARGGSSRGRIKKTTARKKVGAGPRRRLGGGVESGIDSEMLGQEGWAGDEDGGDGRAEEVRGININEAAQATDGAARVNVSGAGGVEDMGNFHIDVDATEDILGNLHNLPFLRVDNLGRMI